MVEKNNIGKNTHTPDKLYSFVLQTRHLLYELLDMNDDEAIVSTELFDDVAVQNNDGILAIQLKSSQSHNNPISDRAIDFWKTMYNWMIYCEENTLDINKTEFKLVINSLEEKQYGDISKSFDEAANKDEALKAIEKAKQELFYTGKNIAEGYKMYIEHFFDEDKLELAKEIISRFSITVFNKNYDETLEKKFRNKVLCDEYYDILYEEIQGWIHEKINGQLKLGKPAFIKYGDFKRKLSEQLKMYRHSKIFGAISVKNTEEQCEDELNRRDNYIKQLEIINAKYDDKISAVDSFLRQSIDKTEWAKRGLFTSKSFDEYENNLMRKWDLINKRGEIIHHNLLKDEVGRTIYYECIMLDIELQGNKLPSYFTQGYYNNLANEMKLGWHPDYREILEEDENRKDV